MSFKVAASDFDGTIFRNEKFSDEDLTAIKNWRSNGNKFGIVTGRCHSMLAPVLENSGLDVDFMICCNGAQIFTDNRLIFEAEVPKSALTAIINEPSVQKTFHFAFEAIDELFCVVLSEKSWVLRENERWDFLLTIIDAAQVKNLTKPINQLALGFSTVEEAQIATDTLNNRFGDVIFAQKNTHSVDIVPKNLNKARGVENLLNLCGWTGAKVFVVGDESNDLPMIRHFGGFTVENAKDFVKREATAVFSSVGELLNNFLDA